LLLSNGGCRHRRLRDVRLAASWPVGAALA
jgi:hypothetical protein